MGYLYWEPPLPIPGDSARARAEAVLAADSVRRLLGAEPEDGFVFDHATPEKHMQTFRQTRAWRDRAVVVDGAYASVELLDDTHLAYIGTGFRKGIKLSGQELALDEAGAGKLAVAAYEREHKAPAKVTPHKDMGLRVHEVSGRGDVLAYELHVEREAGAGFSRPYLFLVDAQRGEVLSSRRSWVE